MLGRCAGAYPVNESAFYENMSVRVSMSPGNNMTALTETTPKRRFQILALDGGGIKGIFSQHSSPPLKMT